MSKGHARAVNHWWSPGICTKWERGQINNSGISAFSKRCAGPWPKLWLGLCKSYNY